MNAPQPEQVPTTAEATSAFWNHAYVAYIPLLGAAVALTFDVGCFSAIDISFFTLFSLSEHIVFAIQALPIAIVLLFPFSIFIIFMLTPDKQYREPAKLHKGQRIALYIILALIVLSLISYVGYALYIISRTNPEFFLIVLIILIASFGLFLIDKSRQSLFTTSMAVISTLVISFVFGYEAGAVYMSDTYETNIFTTGLAPMIVKLKDGAAIRGRLIRSGERGALFYETASAQLHFILWEGISSIEATPRKNIPGGR